MELPFEEFALILGMDWLVKHGATLDCAAKCMVLKTAEGKVVMMIEKHDEHLRIVLQVLRERELYAKFSKANVVADALSRRVVFDLRTMFARLSLHDEGSLLAKLQVRPAWVDQIKEKQLKDESLVSRFQQVEKGETSKFGLNSEGVLCFRGRVYILKDSDLRDEATWEPEEAMQ
ncbi:uncharacterized protein LOC128283900 [Gossypium arboreum]|uniref:uncharacterized protein LOC128283900 n=1 Tax=Gossypium arboreum TaxID=29729 RepID=UPI0022F147A6|nr:uncharacterized protein LOC128283900 [Gossypium arboreum]